MLAKAVQEGSAPILAALLERGLTVTDCVPAFPSVTPVCAASIITGAGQDRHHIPGMNWFHREEGRYIEYGSSFRASQRFGLGKQLIDTVYNMNRAHLAKQPLTIFERLDDAGLRTAGTTYLMYRGRHLHQPQRGTALGKLAASTLMRHPVLGPQELFYADIFASRRTPCSSVLGMPGIRDRHSGCVGAHLVENDLFDFMLLSLPDNDWVSHKRGVDAQVGSIAAADLQLKRVVDAAGGVDAFCEDHAIIVMADHAQSSITAAISLQGALAELDVLKPGAVPDSAKIAVCPSQRAAMVYVLREEDRSELLAPVVKRCAEIEGVELVAWRQRPQTATPAEDAVRRGGKELRFAAGGDLTDEAGNAWSVDGDLDVLHGVVRDGVLLTPMHPHAFARLHRALTCPTSGDVLLSAAPQFEFADWGGHAHIGGGSHGSLRAEDSLCPVIFAGLDDELAGLNEEALLPMQAALAAMAASPESLWRHSIDIDPLLLRSTPEIEIGDIVPTIAKFFALQEEDPSELIVL